MSIFPVDIKLHSIENLVERNLTQLERCRKNKTRYRIRHGVFQGRDVALVNQRLLSGINLLAIFPLAMP